MIPAATTMPKTKHPTPMAAADVDETDVFTVGIGVGFEVEFDVGEIVGWNVGVVGTMVGVSVGEEDVGASVGDDVSLSVKSMSASIITASACGWPADPKLTGVGLNVSVGLAWDGARE